jgi:small subunit ribosomal protein S3
LILKDINKTNAIKYRKKKNNLNPIKQRIAQLRRFKNLIFYKDGINIISNIILHKQPSNVLAEFIASILKRLKQPNSFFIFLKRTLDLFINQPLSKIGGIKILINGRIKKSPRSKTAKIFSGSIPLQTINSNIEHYQTTAYTKKGTLGVKVWVRSKF